MPFPALVVTTVALLPPSLAVVRCSTQHPNRNPNPQRFHGHWSPKSLRLQPKAASAQGGEINENGSEISRATLLWRAAKLPIYSVALVPLTVGFSTAYLHTGLFFARRYLTLLFASVLIITWLNLSNDVYDSDTGVDRDKKESVVNIIGSRSLTQIAANTSLALGFLGLIWASTETGDMRFILLVTCAILCGYVYQCPPFRLSYKGLGEPLCFSAFGPFATTAFYFSNSSKNLSSLPLTRTIISSSVLVGITTTLIIFCSHFHQIDGDRDVGKMSPLVRLGTETGSKVVRLGITMLYLLLFGFSLCRSLPPTCAGRSFEISKEDHLSLFETPKEGSYEFVREFEISRDDRVMCALTLPMGKLVVDFVEQNHNDKVKIFMAKYYCVRMHVLFGTALTAGLLLARTGTKSWFPLAF